MYTETKRQNEKKLIEKMVKVYCRGNHNTGKDGYCRECNELISYANVRIDHCKFMDTKTFCSTCKVHCYKKEKREQIKKVMRYAGPRMMFTHPVLVVKHMLDNIKNRKYN